LDLFAAALAEAIKAQDEQDANLRAELAAAEALRARCLCSAISDFLAHSNETAASADPAHTNGSRTTAGRLMAGVGRQRNGRFSIAAGVKGDLFTSWAFLDFFDLRGLMSLHGALASLRGRRAATS
jgi:hypothetical protein